MGPARRNDHLQTKNGGNRYLTPRKSGMIATRDARGETQ